MSGSAVTKMHEGGPELTEESRSSSIVDPAAFHPTGKRPRSVSIVALGPSSMDWHRAHLGYNVEVPGVDEVWSLNKGLRTIRADVAWVMDDMVGEARKSEQYRRDLNELEIPIITSTVDDEVRKLYPDPDLHEYPHHQVEWFLGVRYYVARGARAEWIEANPAAVGEAGRELGAYRHNSVPHMLAYALWLGVRDIQLYGADYTYPGQPLREDDRANAEYWVGFLRGCGVQVAVTTGTTLLNMLKKPGLYGYGARPPASQDPSPEALGAILNRFKVKA